MRLWERDRLSIACGPELCPWSLPSSNPTGTVCTPRRHVTRGVVIGIKRMNDAFDVLKCIVHSLNADDYTSCHMTPRCAHGTGGIGKWESMSTPCGPELFPIAMWARAMSGDAGWCYQLFISIWHKHNFSFPGARCCVSRDCLA